MGRDPCGADRGGRPPVSRLLLVRHCEPEEDARGRCYGSLDVGLSEAGMLHAHELASHLDGYDAVWTSPRLRARKPACKIRLG